MRDLCEQVPTFTRESLVIPCVNKLEKKERAVLHAYGISRKTVLLYYVNYNIIAIVLIITIFTSLFYSLDKHVIACNRVILVRIVLFNVY